MIRDPTKSSQVTFESSHSLYMANLGHLWVPGAERLSMSACILLQWLDLYTLMEDFGNENLADEITSSLRCIRRQHSAPKSIKVRHYWRPYGDL
jgi:hypothetical protein